MTSSQACFLCGVLDASEEIVVANSRIIRGAPAEPPRKALLDNVIVQASAAPENAGVQNADKSAESIGFEHRRTRLTWDIEINLSR